MPQILVEELSKTYRIAERDAGTLGALKGLFHRRWRTVQALDKVSFQLEKGELVGLIGPNGAGKSTTIKILSGIMEPTSGRCEVDGLTPWRQRVKHVARIGVVFGQRSQLWWDLPVIEGFDLLRDIYRVPQDRCRRLARRTGDPAAAGEAAGPAGAPALARPAHALRRSPRLCCTRPELVFLDGARRIGLDAPSKLAVREFVGRLNRDHGVTVILTTHDMHDIEALAERVIVIGQGKILADGSVEALRAGVLAERRLFVDFASEAPAHRSSPGQQ